MNQQYQQQPMMPQQEQYMQPQPGVEQVVVTEQFMQPAGMVDMDKPQTAEVIVDA